MAAVTGTVVAVSGFTSGTGPSRHSTISAAEWETFGCFVTVEYSDTGDTYASGDDATFDAAAAIQASMQDGRDVVPMGACFVSAGVENGAIVGAKTVAVSGDNVTSELTQEDLSTERDDGAMSATWQKPITYFVSWRAKVQGES